MSVDEYLSLSKIERDVLIAIVANSGEEGAEHPHGAVVKEWIGDKTGSSPYSQSLYGAIATLEDRGFIMKEPINDRDKGLVLTDEGREAIVELRQILSQAEHGDN